MANRVEQRGVMGHYPPVPNEDGIALHKPVILVLSILASIVAYKNVSEKNRKPIAGVILGAGLSYSFGLWKILQSIASILEKDEEEDKPSKAVPRHTPFPAGRQYPLPGQQYPPPHVPHYPPQQQVLHRDQYGNPVDEYGHEMKEQGLGGSRPQMKGHRLDRPQQKQHPWE